MRLTLRFVALILLLTIVALPNSGSMTTVGDEGFLIEETGNACFDGCARGYESCTGRCKLDMSCRQKCEQERMDCHAGCK